MVRAKTLTISFLLLTFAVTTLCGLLACGGGSGGSGSNPPPPPPPAIETAPHPPFRTRYLRTDLQYNPNALQFFPPHLTAYDSVHKRFFVSNTTLNRIDVFDAATESQISSIIVPEPWGMDVSPDGTKLFVATAFGDVYLCDPGAMQVVQRYASSTIGAQGYIATQAFLLASGDLALLGAMGGAYLDGSQTFAIWNSTTNSLQVIYPDTFGASFINIGQIAVTEDRTKVLIACADCGTVVLYDPNTGTGVTAQYAGTANQILPTQDGKRVFIVGTQSGPAVYDATTLTQLGGFTPPATPYGALLSYDGSTLFTRDESGNVYAYDSTTFAQKGWVASFNVLDLQAAIVPSAIDETGLMVGPIGHGVAFLDTSLINPGAQSTQFSISFLTPGFGTLSGGTSVEANYQGTTLTGPTMYIGNASTQSVTVTPTSLTTATPKSTPGGVADFTVVLPDKTLAMMPEDFSYGPTIVEVSTNAASAEGGAQGAIFGYGFGQQPSDAQITIGGQSATVTQLLASASPTFPYPFPMQALLFAVPPGTAGTAADVTVTTADGSATASGAFHYVAAVQSYPLQGASLMQGIYDSFRGVLYFTDRTQIGVFSPTTEAWLPPITLPNTTVNTSLLGVSLSPDGNTLAVSDPGDNAIYVLNPSSPSSAKSFAGVGIQGAPYGLAVTNSGIVYFGTYSQEISPPGGFGKLDSTSGQITDFPPGTLEDANAFTRVLLSPDGSRVFVNEGGYSWILNTSDDSLSEGIQVSTAGNLSGDMTLSSDGSTVLTSDMLTDSGLNVAANIAYVDRDVWLPTAVYGQKLNANGSLAYQPLTTGVDVLDGTTGLLQYRVALPILIADVYDALTIDDADGLLFAITTTGISQISLGSLPANSSARRRSRDFVGISSSTNSRNRFHARPGWTDSLQRPRLRHYVADGSASAGASPKQ